MKGVGFQKQTFIEATFAVRNDVLVITRCLVQYNKYFPRFLHFAKSST